MLANLMKPVQAKSASSLPGGETRVRGDWGSVQMLHFLGSSKVSSPTVSCEEHGNICTLTPSILVSDGGKPPVL